MVTARKISEPVGAGTSSLKGRRPIRNLEIDVSAIQDMLGQIKADEGGTPGLRVTGRIVGPNDPTVLAIRKFQRRQFGFEDGVVDPDNKTERKLRKVFGIDDVEPPAPKTITLDIVVRIMGQDPKNGLAGTPTFEGQSAILVPNVATLTGKIETKEYTDQGLRLSVINFFGGGGRANAASDPSAKILEVIRAQRKAQLDSGNTLGKVMVYGWSIGGRNAATLARKLSGDKITVDYLGLIDAAFDDDKDAERTQTVTASQSDNFFQDTSNELRKDFPAFEFHGEVSGIQSSRMETNDKFYRERKDKFDAGTKNLKNAINCFDDLHKKAVTDGHAKVQQKVINLLTQNR